MNGHTAPDHVALEHVDDTGGIDDAGYVDPAQIPPATEQVGEANVDAPSLTTLAAAVDSLRDALAASRRTQEHQELLLDRLHEEKERLREAEQRRQRDPVIRELIQLSDTYVRTSRQWLGRGDVSTETAEKVSAALAETAADVRLILERQGVEDFEPNPEERFQRSESKAVGTKPTSDPDREGRVAEVRKPGYRMGERVLRFSEVVVWRYEPGPVMSEEPVQPI
jgi:molecular chaperone GrpE (heat shock protein)